MTWTKSRELLSRAQKSLAGGVSSPFRAKFPVPLFLNEGRGSRVRDVDGNSYIDYTLAWGPLILGHRHPRLVEAVSQQALGAHSYGAQHENEYVVAEQIQRMVPCAERVAFTSSGSEAVQIALRLARAYTRRNVILKFEGHYHGWMDSVLISYHPAAADIGPAESPNTVLASRGQVPNAADNIAVAVWNSEEAVERIFAERGAEIAAVIMEPVLCNSGSLLPAPGYLERVKQLCRHNGSLLIFDEVITGFRMATSGAQGFYNVTPDLATFGKAIAGGLALSAIGGREDIMAQMFNGGVAFGGTFNGNPLSLAAARATLDVLSDKNGAALAHANRMGGMLMEGFRSLARKHSVPLTVTGFGGAFSIHFTTKPALRDYRDVLADDPGLLASFLMNALAEGIYLLPDGRLYVSVVHSEADISETLECVDRALGRLETTAAHAGGGRGQAPAGPATPLP